MIEEEAFSERLLRRIHEAQLISEVEETFSQHCFLVVDPESGYVWATGPYPDAFTAGEAADAYRKTQLEQMGPPPLETFVVQWCPSEEL